MRGGGGGVGVQLATSPIANGYRKWYSAIIIGKDCSGTAALIKSRAVRSWVGLWWFENLKSGGLLEFLTEAWPLGVGFRASLSSGGCSGWVRSKGFLPENFHHKPNTRHKVSLQWTHENVRLGPGQILPPFPTPGRVLASRVSGHHLHTQTPINHTSWHPKDFVSNFYKCNFSSNNWIFSPKYDSSSITKRYFTFSE